MAYTASFLFEALKTMMGSILFGCSLSLSYSSDLFISLTSVTMATEKEIKGIELTVHSCKNLKVFNFLKKVVAYAVVWIGDRKKRQKTPRDAENNRNPEWKHKMWFDMDRLGYTIGATVSSLGLNYLEFEIRVDGVMGVGKTIGRVQIPIKDLVDAYKGSNTAASYQITGSNDEHTGLLNFCYTIEYHKVDGGGSSHAQSLDRIQLSCRCERPQAQPPRPTPSAPGPIDMIHGHQRPPAAGFIPPNPTHHLSLPISLRVLAQPLKFNPLNPFHETRYQAPAILSSTIVAQPPKLYPPYPFHETNFQAQPAPPRDGESRLRAPVLSHLLPETYPTSPSTINVSSSGSRITTHSPILAQLLPASSIHSSSAPPPPKECLIGPTVQIAGT